MFGFRSFGKRGWLRPWVLSIIAKSPKNGVEIMDEVERMSWGSWRPSPGSVYPLLDELTNDGFVRKMEDGRYEITDKGKQESDFSIGFPFRSGPRSVEQMLGEISSYISYFEDLARSDKSKLAASENRIHELADRLSKLSLR